MPVPTTWTGGQVADALRDGELPGVLDRLGLRPEDVAELLPPLRSLDDVAHEQVAAAASLLEAAIGETWEAGGAGKPARGASDPFADLADEPGRPAGLLPLAALVVTAEAVRAHHRGRDIDEAVSERTLTDLGQQVWVHRQTFGTAGLHTQRWLRTAWGGGLLWLGRLQFELRRFVPESLEPVSNHPVPSEQQAGQWVLSVHIPQTGPLDPEAVDASFAMAQRVFASRYPEHAATAFHCASWLLDPCLPELLPATSNLVRFQRRWELLPGGSDADADALFFVFHRRFDSPRPGGPELDLDALPQETTLQRAVVERLRAGRRWQLRTGLVPLAPARH